MKRILLSITFIHLLLNCYSQQYELRGKVVDDKNVPLIGVNVINESTASGVISNIDGAFTIAVEIGDSIKFSYIGYKEIKIAVSDSNNIKVVLNPDYYKVDEVVVTALGIKKESKALGYAATNVKGEEISRSQDNSFLNALQGKIAGVNISSASGSPGASSRIIIRGVSSLTGSNTPLFVVDGIPVSNSFSGSSSINGGTDFGNKANDINPEDIEDVTILKGSAATVKYGSRAANGVIEIITKKGRGNNKDLPFLTYSGSIQFERPLRLVDYQNSFGQGIYGEAVSFENMSWGPRFDGTIRPWGYVVDDEVRLKGYSGLPSNVKDFFDRGYQLNNSFSFSGGNDITTYYFSYSNINSDGTFPTDADSYNRHTVSVRTSNKFSEKFSNSVAINYIYKHGIIVPTGQGDQSVYNQVMQTPRDISLLELEDINSKWNNLDNYYSLYTLNPYYILKKNKTDHTEDRTYGNFEFTYNILDELAVQWKFGGDVANEETNSFNDIAIPEGNNKFSAIYEPGSSSASTIRRQQYTNNFLLSYNRDFNGISLSVLTGSSFEEFKNSIDAWQVNALTLPGNSSASNGSESPLVSNYESIKRMARVLGSVDVGFKSVYYISFSASNAWSSSLPKENNSFFYPGVSSSFVFTELFSGMKNFFPFGKLRMSWSKVGNDAPIYSIEQIFSRSAHGDGFSYFSYPLANNVSAYSVGNVLGNKELKPEITTDYEIGTDLRFFSNRLGIDVSYYYKIIENQILPVPIAASSGYTTQIMNLGEIENEGVEALLNIKIIKSNNWNWSTAINFSKNNSLLLSLNDNIEKVNLTAPLTVDGGQQIYYVAKPGEPIGVFEARTVLTNEKGQIVVDNNGLPRAAEDLVEYGNSNYDYNAGISNLISYKNISFGFNIDIRQGGIMYSRTKDISTWAGTVPLTLYNDREPFIIPNSVIEIDQDENGNPIYVDNTIVIDDQHLLEYWGNGGTELDGNSFIDKSYIKLREVSLYYEIPQNIASYFKLKSMSCGVIARNVFIITPKDQKFIDPEVTTFGNDIGSNFGEYGAQPSNRSINFSIRLSI